MHVLPIILVLNDSDDYGDGGGFIPGVREDPGDESTIASSTAPSSSLACWSAASDAATDGVPVEDEWPIPPLRTHLSSALAGPLHAPT